MAKNLPATVPDGSVRLQFTGHANGPIPFKFGKTIYYVSARDPLADVAPEHAKFLVGTGKFVQVGEAGETLQETPADAEGIAGVSTKRQRSKTASKRASKRAAE